MIDSNQVWQNILTKAEGELSASIYEIFFKNSSLKLIEKPEEVDVQILCQNSFIRENLKLKHHQLIERELAKTIKKKLNLDYLVKANEKRESKEESPLFAKETQTQVSKQVKSNLYKRSAERARLKVNNTFENFAVSPSNEVAYAAAGAVAKNPSTAYNPLFLYGDVGVGKTHLMHAIGLRILKNSPETKLVYCAGEEFTNEIIEAIRNKNTPAFRNRYRKAQALLIDDIQFIAGKNTVQEEFFHTFNAIKNTGGQVILTSDRPPHEIKLLEDRLRSRFEEGLTIDIQQPNFELRTAILLIKSEQMGKHLSMEVAQTIANHITSTRKLQGFLSKLFAIASFKNQLVTRELAIQIMGSQIDNQQIKQPQKYINPKEIVEAVAKHFNITVNALYGPRRNRPIVVPRQYAMYLLRADLDMPYVEIGRIFGGRDHSTVMHSVDKISKLVSQSEEMKMEFSTIRKQIYG
jgi:chromosomal replication initiator protein